MATSLRTAPRNVTLRCAMPLPPRHGTVAQGANGKRLVCDGRLRRFYVRRGDSFVPVGRYCDGCGALWAPGSQWSPDDFFGDDDDDEDGS